jgi:hypothetical protein
MDGWIDRENIGEQRRQIIEKWMEKETSKQTQTLKHLSLSGFALPGVTSATAQGAVLLVVIYTFLS